MTSLPTCRAILPGRRLQPPQARVVSSSQAHGMP